MFWFGIISGLILGGTLGLGLTAAPLCAKRTDRQIATSMKAKP